MLAAMVPMHVVLMGISDTCHELARHDGVLTFVVHLSMWSVGLWQWHW